mmetsp:Transcript_93613/g.270460  ORF Transcript_93613/g.270460 Transcript_93613/m.270460 type:complete len:224 (+) Transcript_93613:410-1081(+)
MLGVFYVNAHGVQHGADSLVTHARRELGDVECAVAIVIQGLQDARDQLRLLLLLLPPQLERILLIRFGMLHRVLDEDACQDVHHRESEEGDVECEGQGGQPTNGVEQHHDPLPIFPTGGAHGEGDHGALYALKVISLLLPDFIGLLLDRKLLLVGRHLLHEEEREDVEDQAQHDDRPKQRGHRAENRGHHHAQLLKKPHGAEYPQDLPHLEDAQRPRERHISE